MPKLSPQMLAAILALFLFETARGTPSISSFSPTSGQAGNVIVINGMGLGSTTNVTFNPSSPTLGDFVANSDSQLLVVVPIGASTGPIKVYTTGGSVSTSTSFSSAPSISSFAPQSGSNPTEVYIQGANFVVGATTVTFPGVATPVNGTVIALTEVGAVVPVGAANGPLIVTTPAGTAVSTNNFLASSTPTISSFSPIAGIAGTAVIINGGNFFSGSVVKFNGTTASSAITSTTQISATVPSGATTGPISVTVGGMTAQTSSNFMTGTAPIITDFYPQIGTINPPTPVTIDGFNLAGVTSVTFNGGTEYLAGHSGSTGLSVDVTNATGTGTIKITGGGSFITSSNFSSAGGPFITDFYPTLGAVGLNVVIDGENFTGAKSVTFNGHSATYTVTSPTQITAVVPSGATSGPITVASNSASSTTTSNFTVTTGAPTIISFTPTNGVQGAVVTINGGQFTNLSAVQFNGVSATYLPPTSTTVLYATVPAQATTGPITVKNSTGPTSSAGLFYLQPWITNFVSSNIVNLPLILQGRNLTNATSVVVGGVNYTSFTNSPTQIVAPIPSNAVTGPITITTPGGIFITTNSLVILPKIYSFTPDIGPAGTVVTVNGTSLFNVSSVQFNGVSATPFNVTTNQLQVAVPTGATPGHITVITPYGKDVSTNIFTATYSSTVDLSKTVTPLIAGPGTNVTYTLVVTNRGPSIVTSVNVMDSFSNAFNVASFSSTLGTLVHSNNQIIATIPFLTNNTSATITVTGTATAVGAVTNTATLSFAEGNTASGTNFAYAIVAFINAAQHTLSVSKSTIAGQFNVTWPVSAANYTLQVSTNLSKSNGWQAVTGGLFVTNGVNEYTNAVVTNKSQFFRLEAP